MLAVLVVAVLLLLLLLVGRGRRRSAYEQWQEVAAVADRWVNDELRDLPIAATWCKVVDPIPARPVSAAYPAESVGSKAGDRPRAA